MDIKKVTTILQEWFNDPIDDPCPYCEAAKEICQLQEGVSVEERMKVWEICQEVRLGNLSEQEATDQICQLTEPKYNSVIISKLPRRKRPDLVFPDDELILVTRGNEHPEERIPLYKPEPSEVEIGKPVFFRTNETGTSYRKIAQGSEADIPLARIWSEDKTTGIATGANKPECEACADGFISAHEKATAEIRAIKDAEIDTEHTRLVEVARSAGRADGYKKGLVECRQRLERIKREIEERGLVTRPDGTISEDEETVIEIDDMDWWQEVWKRKGIK